MLSKSFSMMEDSIWERCPSTTNAVERRNRDCKSDTPQCLKLAMIKVYKVDKVTCLKHMAAEDGIVLSYRSKSEEARRMTAKKNRSTERDHFLTKNHSMGHQIVLIILWQEGRGKAMMLTLAHPMK